MRTIWAVGLALSLAAPAAAHGSHEAAAAGKPAAGTPGKEALNRMAKLLGHWEATHDGKPVQNWLKLISGGTTLLETFKIADEPEMVSLYYLDKGALEMTHYCSANNQPRMRATGGDDKSLSFAFQDATNLASLDDGHMNALTIRFQDGDHFTERWTWLEKGKTRDAVFEFSRQKPPAEPKK